MQAFKEDRVMGWLAGLLGAADAARAVDVTEAKRRRDAGALLIDVREADEWRAGHAPGARHIPLRALAGRLAEVPRDREVLLICRGGNRSGTARELLVRQGFARARNVTGGMLAWTRAGLPTTGPGR
jgi:rhodanese-related sulfurtransferase